MRSLKKFIGTIFLSSLLLVGAAIAAPDHPVYKPGKPFLVTGAEANGGFVDAYLGTIRLFRQDRVTAVLDRWCQSSCTLYTALLKDGLLCARPGTILVFHQFVKAGAMDIEGNILKAYKVRKRITGAEFARIWGTYPYQVRQAIMKRSPNGGLPAHGEPLKIPATDLGIPTC